MLLGGSGDLACKQQVVRGEYLASSPGSPNLRATLKAGSGLGTRLGNIYTILRNSRGRLQTFMYAHACH